ncbi:flavoprotein [Cryptococcus wingfieldii CBS 7118]|uniref:Flavoprotein n=1 Tax=Cryptococcus wingfieldii CBS 7118 TaxID=1295528 RepID=A0A1E3K2P5_9TREE|nr:flavoprotein [Cryptococcus wingfieldii CBS 7118]ODO07253.1 flavoprotein [Cryptococcus wingfieldii CBS 7118]
MSSNDDVLTKSVLPENELKNGDMKTVEFGDGKVLVSKIKGQLYATSAFCTHYGAPLEKGVLSHDGRVVCPWHGACFNVCTGDVEDAPGLDSLWSFTATTKDGQIVVSASKKEVASKVGRVITKKGTKQVSPKGSKSEETVVIVGGGSGAIHAIESLRINGFVGKIVVISEENHAPIDRTKMSKGLVDDADKLQWRKPDELKDAFGVDFYPGTAINLDTQTVSTSSGSNVKYDHLILSPGGTPRKIPIPGADLSGVLTLRHVPDTKAITSSLTEDSEVVLIGTSFISMEAAVAIVGKKPKSVTLVGMDEVPFEKLMGKEFGQAIMEGMKSQGIKFHMKAKIEKITPSESDPSHVGAVHVEGLDPIPANLVIMGTGVAPATSFLKDTLKLEEDGGVKVDEYLRVPGHENVYAIGDIAHYVQYPAKFPRRVEHWNVAGNHASRLAHTITHPESPVAYTKVPIFWSSIGKGLRYLGTGAGFDDQYVDGSFKDLKFAVYQAKEGKVTAIATMQRDPIVAKASELMRLDIMPSIDDIRNGKNILEIDLAEKSV